jgi:hypothetical protein
VTKPRTASPEERAAAEAEARFRFGTDKLRPVVYPQPIGAPIELLVVDFNGKSYAGFADFQMANGNAAGHAKAFMEHVVFPPKDERIALKRKWPALPRKIARALLVAAGQDDRNPAVLPLDLASLPEWLPADKAAELMAAAEEDETTAWTVEKGRLRVVMFAPEPEVYLASQEAQRRVAERKSGIVEATLGYTRDLVKFEAEPLDKLVDELPALPYESLDRALDVMAGEVAELEMRSFS